MGTIINTALIGIAVFAIVFALMYFNVFPIVTDKLSQLGAGVTTIANTVVTGLQSTQAMWGVATASVSGITGLVATLWKGRQMEKALTQSKTDNQLLNRNILEKIGVIEGLEEKINDQNKQLEKIPILEQKLELKQEKIENQQHTIDILMAEKRTLQGQLDKNRVRETATVD